MSLRSPLTNSVRSFSLGSAWAGVMVALGLFAVSAAGCGGCDDPQAVCDKNGENCQICDGYGCHPAMPGVGGGGSGGGTTASTGATTGTGGAPCDPEKTTCGCSSSADCSGGKQCVGGLCIDGCNFSYQCGAGKVCIDGSCTVGCDATTPCDAGYKCDNGGCVLDPTNPGCDVENVCPTGEICVNGVCTTGCTSNGDCGTGEVCDATSGSCIPDPSTKPVCGDSTSCQAPAQCLSDGFCHYPCTDLSGCKLIDNRFVACSGGFCQTDEEANAECSIAKPCPSGQSCVSGQCK